MSEHAQGTAGKVIEIKGFREIIEGKHDDLPEAAFYMVGTIEAAVAKAEKSAAAAA